MNCLKSYFINNNIKVEFDSENEIDEKKSYEIFNSRSHRVENENKDNDANVKYDFDYDPMEDF